MAEDGDTATSPVKGDAVTAPGKEGLDIFL